MRKIVLKLDELRVETFDTSVAEPERGTVHAQSETDYIRICTDTFDCVNTICMCSFEPRWC